MADPQQPPQVAQLAQQVADLQDMIAQLQAQQIPPQQQGQARQEPIFAQAPAGLNANQLIDYSTAVGVKIYKAATAPLKTEFDLDEDHLMTFLNNVKARAIEHEWVDSILTVPQDGNQHVFFDSYGILHNESVRAHVLTYAHMEGRAQQNSANLYQFLWGSLTEEAQTVLLDV